uniref:Protein OPI10 homolog n=1 Tax=Cacopsylla melanoneura TaxID=428564 RepID=A0A8D9A4M0_9HEMI
MFAILVSGRLVQTNYELVAENRFLFTIPEADTINHVAVFMTGSIPFPEGMGGMVYFNWPEPDAPSNWKLLGVIANEKPSSIFKISNLKSSDKHLLNGCTSVALYNPFGQQPVSHNAQIGISVEPLQVVNEHMTSKTNESMSNFVLFCQKMITNFVNFTSSFSVSQSTMGPNPKESYVPISSVQSWYQNFERKLSLNPNFWQSL